MLETPVETRATIFPTSSYTRDLHRSNNQYWALGIGTLYVQVSHLTREIYVVDAKVKDAALSWLLLTVGRLRCRAIAKVEAYDRSCERTKGCNRGLIAIA